MLLCLALAACGATGPGVGRTTRTQPPPAGARQLADASPAPGVSAPPGRPGPLPAVARLRAALTRVLDRAGPAVGAYVFDLTRATPLFDLGADVARPPASVEKLYTTVAALKLLGPASTLATTVLGSGRESPGGVWRGNLYLRGGGDPTFGDGLFNRVWEQGYGPTAAELASALRAHGIRRVTGRLIGDGSLFGDERAGPATAFAPDVPDFGGELGGLVFDHGATAGSLTPQAFAARQLARTMRSVGIRVRAAPMAGVTPPGASPLASVSSPPLSVIVRLMDVPSDDLFAEMLTELLGVRYGGSGSIGAGAAVISGQIAPLGVSPRILDGSGLSRGDASSPLQVVTLLRAVWRTGVGRELIGALPVVGQSGTVSQLGAHTPAAGHCAAKTGTLTGVTNLAGICASQGGDTLAFALFLDGPSNWQAYPMLSRLVAAIARY